MKKIAFAVVLGVVLGGCASTGVIQTGPDSYMSRAHSTMFSLDVGGGGAIANATKLGTKECAKQGKNFVMNNYQTRPIGAGASAVVNFECVDKSDQDYRRPKITPQNSSPQVIINNN